MESAGSGRSGVDALMTAISCALLKTSPYPCVMVRSSVTSRSKAALSARAKALSRSRSKLTISCSAALNGVTSLLFVWLRQRVEAIARAEIREMIFIGLLLLGLRNNSDAQHGPFN